MRNRTTGKWPAIGIAIRTGMGVAMRNIPVGVGLGAALGALLGMVQSRGEA